MNFVADPIKPRSDTNCFGSFSRLVIVEFEAASLFISQTAPTASRADPRGNYEGGYSPLPIGISAYLYVCGSGRADNCDCGAQRGHYSVDHRRPWLSAVHGPSNREPCGSALTLASATNTVLVVTLPGNLRGSYLLKVTDSNGASGTFSVTIGAVGPQGPQGIQGNPGDKGDKGDPGLKGFRGPSVLQVPRDLSAPIESRSPRRAGIPSTRSRDAPFKRHQFASHLTATTSGSQTL